MAAYELSTATLRNVLSNPSLNLDKVDETMDNLASAIADSKEIDDAVRLGGEVAVAASGVDVGADDDELADELAALVEEEKAAQAERESKERAAAAAQDALRARQEADKKTADEAKARRADSVKQSEKDWQAVHDAAQQRKAEETARTEAERLKKDEARVAAE